ncbi:hemerythrin domain-containing protein [Bacillus sp. FJAT-45066]|uniref:hemerythrin domain-containing protein n=1 Tax=Bacillus sp. FJAT-45066 TaxID=2011010 RepID=UPI000BB89E53|nr:hemerythrin domain-containing protein [Bacillus sp. FJAT-45066]
MNQCGLFQQSAQNVPLCEALGILKAEHTPLNEAKANVNSMASQFLEESMEGDYADALLTLRKEVQLFFDSLKVHSEKEEGILFPMMHKYIGKDSGPLVVMEYEHDEAKRNIVSFLEGTDFIAETITEEKFQKLVTHVKEAYEILTAHFMKEEMVLFPMAEQYLTVDEKTELLLKVK